MAFHSPLRPCTSPGCQTRVPNGRCDRHLRLAKGRHQNWTAVYGPDWPRIRLDYLCRHPICVLCGRMANTADHYPKGIRILTREGQADPHADHHLRALCQPCHARETGLREPGGFRLRG